MEYGQDYFGFVYIWYDRFKKRLCIGSHYGSYEDGYTSSTGHFRESYSRRPAHFMRRIVYWLPVQDLKLLQNKEQEWLNKIPDDELGKRFYNFKKTASGGNGKANKGKRFRWMHNPEAGEERCVRGETPEGFVKGRSKTLFPKIAKKRRSYLGEGNPLYGKKRSDFADYNRLPKKWMNDGFKSYFILISDLDRYPDYKPGRIRTRAK
jgi:hypothetical protein